MNAERKLELEKKFRVTNTFDLNGLYASLTHFLKDELALVPGRQAFEFYTTYEQYWHPPVGTTTEVVRLRQREGKPLELTTKAKTAKAFTRLETTTKLPDTPATWEALDRQLGLPARSFYKTQAVWQVPGAEVCAYKCGFENQIFLEVEADNEQRLEEVLTQLKTKVSLVPESQSVFELSLRSGLVYLCSRVAADAHAENDKVASALTSNGSSIYVPHKDNEANARGDHDPKFHSEIFQADLAAMLQATRCVVVAPAGRDCSWEIGWFSSRRVPTYLWTSGGPRGLEFLQDPMVKGNLRQIFTDSPETYAELLKDPSLVGRITLLNNVAELAGRI